MLRHKLLIILFSLTAMLMVLAMAALWSLQSVFVDLDHLQTASQAVDHVNELNTTLSTIEVELHALQTGRTRHLDTLIDQTESMHRLAQALGGYYVSQDPAIEPTYTQLMTRIEGFDTLVGVLATADDREVSRQNNVASITAVAQMRYDLLLIARHVQSHARAEQAGLTGRFRWLIVAIALGFLVVINMFILLMLKTAGMILKPVDRLVYASRELAKENFAHRVTMGQADEFDELARAYNQMAQQLQENERLRVQTLQQTALTLNHELNNAIATIDLQLTLLRRRSGPDEVLHKSLGQIQENLQRMARVIASLKNLKRVVLTDYVNGVKMLDLHESTREDESRVTADP